MIQLLIALTVSPRSAHLPSSHVHLAVGTPQCDGSDWEERLCRELATLAQTHTRASCCLLLLWCCCTKSIAVGSGAATTAAYSLVLCLLITCNEKTKGKKERHKKQRKTKNFGKVLFPNN